MNTFSEEHVWTAASVFLNNNKCIGSSIFNTLMVGVYTMLSFQLVFYQKVHKFFLIIIKVLEKLC